MFLLLYFSSSIFLCHVLFITHTHILGLHYLRGPELYTILPRTTLSTLLRMSRNVLFSRTICQYAIHRHCLAILLLVNMYFALTPHRIREDLLRGLQRSAVNILCRWFLLVHLLHTFVMTGLRGPHIFWLSHRIIGPMSIIAFIAQSHRSFRTLR